MCNLHNVHERLLKLLKLVNKQSHIIFIFLSSLAHFGKCDSIQKMKSLAPNERLFCFFYLPVKFKFQFTGELSQVMLSKINCLLLKHAMLITGYIWLCFEDISRHGTIIFIYNNTKICLPRKSTYIVYYNHFLLLIDLRTIYNKKCQNWSHKNIFQLAHFSKILPFWTTVGEGGGNKNQGNE